MIQSHNSLAMGSYSDLPALERKLEGKVALISGGASGIGACTAKLFSKHGAKVIIADVQDELGAKVCAALGPDSSYVHCDVTDEAHVSAAVDHAVATFGRLDIMFNNAGTGGEPKGSILESTQEEFERVLAVNLVGPFLGTKHAARVMVPARRGVIVGTASVAGMMGGVASHAYTCSKAGLVALTRNAAVELGRFGVRVNSVAPAALATPLATGYVKVSDEELEAVMRAAANLKGPTLTAEDVAAAVLYLASDDAKYVSGHNLVLDGGFSITNPHIDVFRTDA